MQGGLFEDKPGLEVETFLRYRQAISSETHWTAL
jgi:hypothetical protein